MSTYEELVERATQAILNGDNPYIGHQIPQDPVAAGWAAQAALDAAGVPDLIQVAVAAERLAATSRLYENLEGWQITAIDPVALAALSVALERVENVV